MKLTTASLFLVFAILLLGGCSKQPSNQAAEPANAAGETSAAQASPSDLPAVVTLTDGSHYNGVLVSKDGDQMTFRGENWSQPYVRRQGHSEYSLRIFRR